MRLSGARIDIAAVETTTQELLALRDPDRNARLIVSGNRAAALKLANEREAADPEAPVMLERTAWLDAEAALPSPIPGAISTGRRSARSNR